MFRDNHIRSNNKGNKRYAFIAFVFFVQLFISNYSFAKEFVSVGVVNVTYLMEKAPQSEVASALLKSKFSPQEKKLALELDELNKLEVELDKIKKIKKERHSATSKRTRAKI